MTMMHLPETTAADGRSGSGDPQRPGGRKRGLRIAGVTIRLTIGGYVLATLTAAAGALTLPAAAPGWPAGAYLIATASLVALVVASVTGHELAHAIVARRYGAATAEISVGFLSAVSHGQHDCTTPRAAWRVAAAGPAASIAAAGISAAAAFGLSALGAGTLPVTVFAGAAWINGLLVSFNLLPGAGLDGGQIVRAFAWARSGDPTRAGLAAARFGQITGAILTAAGLTAVALGHLYGIWIGTVCGSPRLRHRSRTS